MKEGHDFPQGDKTLRKEDHQAFVREFIYEVHDGKYHIKDVVPKDKTIVPPACQFVRLSDRRDPRSRRRPRRQSGAAPQARSCAPRR